MKKIPENNEQEHFLSDWMSGKITDEQLREKVSPEDFDAYRKLRFSLQAMALAEPDLERNFDSVKNKIVSKQSRRKSKVRSMYVYTSLAAALLLLLGLYQLLAFSNTFQTDYGQTKSLLLSDDSKVVLNAHSEISYPTFFRYNRNLKLDGQAYFHVAKGSTFTVETAQGNVQVLGTQFDVNAQKDFLEVHCFEGKVKVTTAATTAILTRGKSVRVFQQKVENWDDDSLQKPAWLGGESSFRNAPLQVVIAQFEHQYHCQVEFPQSLAEVRFTGSFTHRDRTIALKSICSPMKLQFAPTSSGTIRISE